MLSVLRSTYAWLLLSAIVLPMFPATWLFARLTRRSDPERARLRVLVARWVSLYARLTPLYRFEVEGREHLPDQGPYVLVANHESGLDVLSMLYLRSPARFLAEAWIFKTPLAGSLLRRCRHIRVKPGDRASASAALAEASEALVEGAPVMIFPEGALSPDGLNEFRPGAFVVAKRARVPIVPVLLEGTGSAWRPGTLIVEGVHEIRIAILPAIVAEDVAAASVEVLASRARSAIVAARRSAASERPAE